MASKLLLTNIAPARRSLFSLLGLLVACGPSPGGGDSDTGTNSTSTATITTPTTGALAGCAGEVVELMQRHSDPPALAGYQRCDDGLVHRAAARACVMPQTPSNCPENATGPCKTNDDCTEKPFGSCQFSFDLLETCGCVYGCETDDDCGEGMVCQCAGDEIGTATRCIPAGCRTDADCGDLLCALSPEDFCTQTIGELACQTPQDECDAHSDCQGVACVFESMRWQCEQGACGRPFVVDDAPVHAPAVPRDDWRGLVAAPSAPLALRSRLAAHWTRVASFEHASVASFARFILELLAIGAPPELVLAAQQALADEVEHARIGYALASVYAGTGIGPGPLASAAATRDGDVDALIAAAIAEACVAETLAGLELVEAAAHAHDPGLRRVLTRIAGDEQRHAELGWRFVQWALQGAGPAGRARAQQAFAAAIAQADAELQGMSEDAGEPELRAHGVVDAPLRAAVWRRGLDAMIRPAAAGLCAA
ncbi:ferritin-like domain-containing protein [Nannocystis pusilla]|uniref:Ferritin-like domain-containing protein n=1 Tax=Nannocystis pusilla TaxID=889268 RepID=A0ABS7TLV1_9BACT|nr:ferritin-like domain-containing protein [Nannocystis pusilla]MBZ5709194.1 ferritin-like domain-containing protein [Nannocystis pusilla]